MRYKLLISCLLFSMMMAPAIHAQQQLTTEFLEGQWRLVNTHHKQISDVEKQKRYLFLQDTLYYLFNKQLVQGKFSITDTKDGFTWEIKNMEKMSFKLKISHKDTVLLYDYKSPEIKGVLARMPSEGITHYNNALIAEKNKDFQKAYELYHLAAHYDNDEAMLKLGMYYLTGTATEINEETASWWIRKSANLGNPDAQAIVNSNSLRY